MSVEPLFGLSRNYRVMIDTKISASSGRRVLGASVLLTISSIGFMVPGLVRTKMAGLVMGEHGIALFGQLSQMQTLLITLGGAGLATATRVMLARDDMSPRERDSAQSWLLWVPASLSFLMVVVVAALGGQIAQLILGQDRFSIEIVLAAAGIPLAVMGQIVLATAQARREISRLVAAAMVAAALGGVVVAVLMAFGDPILAAASLVAGPAVQLAVIASICRSARRGFVSVPRLDKPRRQEVSVLAWASLVLGGFAAASELTSRSSVVYFRGLVELAAYQPVALLVTTSMSLILGSIATSSLMELAQTKDRLLLGRKIAEIAAKVTPILGIVISAVIALSPLAVALLYVPSLVMPSAPLIVLAFAGEPLRALAWIAGSCLLPLGHRASWLAVGLLTVGVQAGVSLSLASSWGAYALVAGLVAASLVTVLSTVIVLRRGSIRIGTKAPLVSGIVSVGVSGLPMLSYFLLSSVVPGAALAMVLLVIYMLVQKRSQPKSEG